MELRKLIVANYKAGMKVTELSRIFQVGKSTIWKLLKKERETGSIEPEYHGKKSSITDEQCQAMFDLVEEEPDITLEEIRERLDLPIHKSQISNLLCQAGYHFKKRWYMPRNANGQT